ncbi:hypothetical protein VWM68_10320, partial [Campylobacter coli]
YELQIGYANHALWEEIETIYLMPNLKNAFISSSIVRSIASHGVKSLRILNKLTQAIKI